MINAKTVELDPLTISGAVKSRTIEGLTVGLRVKQDVHDLLLAVKVAFGILACGKCEQVTGAKAFV